LKTEGPLREVPANAGVGKVRLLEGGKLLSNSTMERPGVDPESEKKSTGGRETRKRNGQTNTEVLKMESELLKKLARDPLGPRR